MPYEIVTVPCLQDNYAFVIANLETREAAVVDVPEAEPINEVLAKRGWTLTTVLLTHHHDDHVQGLDELTGRTGLSVIGASADAHRLPALDVSVFLKSAPAGVLRLAKHWPQHRPHRAGS